MVFMWKILEQNRDLEALFSYSQTFQGYFCPAREGVFFAASLRYIICGQEKPRGGETALADCETTAGK